MVHTPALGLSTVNATGRPEVAVADRIGESTPRVPEAGTVKVIDWGFPVTVIVRWTWAAAW